MKFKEKAYKTLTHKAEGILAAELFVTKEGLAAYSKVTTSPSYYLASSDRSLWSFCEKAISDYAPQDTPILEYGPGDKDTVQKTARMVRALDSRAYNCIDLSQNAIEQALNYMASLKDGISLSGTLSDFWGEDVTIPPIPNLSLFAGGSIENLDVSYLKAPPHDLLSEKLAILAQRTHNGWLAISIDTWQERFSSSFYEKAYSDDLHAQFNLGVFARMKDELGLDITPEAFSYRAEFDANSGAIKHMAYATQDQTFLFDKTPISIKKGEPFLLQNSFRFTPSFFLDCAQSAGLTPLKIWDLEETPMQLFLFKASGPKEKRHLLAETSSARLAG